MAFVVAYLYKNSNSGLFTSVSVQMCEDVTVPYINVARLPSLDAFLVELATTFQYQQLTGLGYGLTVDTGI